MTMQEMQAEALQNAKGNQSTANYAAIFEGFAAKGIPQSDIMPRENVFTFHAWKALGRSVKKGEHGVKVVTYIQCGGSERDPSTGEVADRSFRRPHTTTVFHISQTELTSDRPARASGHRSAYKPRPTGYYGHNKPVTDCYPDPGELGADRWNETH